MGNNGGSLGSGQMIFNTFKFGLKSFLFGKNVSKHFFIPSNDRTSKISKDPRKILILRGLIMFHKRAKRKMVIPHGFHTKGLKEKVNSI